MLNKEGGELRQRQRFNKKIVRLQQFSYNHINVLESVLESFTNELPWMNQAEFTEIWESLGEPRWIQRFWHPPHAFPYPTPS